MSDFGFVNRRDNVRGGKRTSLTGGPGSGPQPTAGQGQAGPPPQYRANGEGGGGGQAAPGRGRPPAPPQQQHPRRNQQQDAAFTAAQMVHHQQQQQRTRPPQQPQSQQSQAQQPRQRPSQPPPSPYYDDYDVSVGVDVGPDDIGAGDESGVEGGGGSSRRRKEEKRGATYHPAASTQKRVPEETAGTGTGTGTASASTSASASADTSSYEQALASSIKEVAALKTTVEDLVKKSSAIRDSSTQFFGLIEGGVAGRALLFDNIPKEMAADKATAKADRDAWVKLSYPQTRIERILPNGSSCIDLWLRAYAICPRTSDISNFWVRAKAEDDTPTFKRFSWYPTPDK